MVRTLQLVSISFLILFAFSCTNADKSSNPNGIDIDIDSTLIKIKYTNELFSVPSPHQTMALIRKYNLEFQQQLLLDPKNYSHYNSQIETAVILGAYGTDMGYLNLYNKAQESLNYFKTLQKLAEQLELIASVDESLLIRIEENIENADSIMKLMGLTFKQFDGYLKRNNREMLGYLIMTGGWIESFYLALNNIEEEGHPELLRHIADQKEPLNNLIHLMKGYYNHSEEYDKIFNTLVDLAYEFDCIDIAFNYAPSATDTAKGLTYINVDSEVKTYNYSFKQLAQMLTRIRQQVMLK